MEASKTEVESLIISPDRVGVYFIIGISGLVFVIGIGTAFVLSDAYYIARSGAAIVAVTLLITLIQFRRDEAIQRTRGSIDEIANRTYQEVLAQSDESTAAEAESEVRQHYEEATYRARQILLLMFIVGTFAGTIVHGFGDIAGSLLLGIPNHH